MSQTEQLKHTPGPWEYRENSIWSVATGYPIATTVYILHHQLEADQANGKIMAAALDLLEALSFCVSVIKSNGVFERSEELAIEKAAAAIEKATR